jgi:hypothetical protein
MAAHFDWEKAPAESRRAMWCWLALLLLTLTTASIIVGAAWLGVGVQGHPALARLAITDKVWLPAMLVLWVAGGRALSASGRRQLSQVYIVLAPISLGSTVFVLSKLLIAPALVVIGLLVVLMLAAYGISWLLFWPGYEERCPTWLSF